MKAKIIQLKMFEHNVAIGNDDFKFDFTISEIPNRAKLPIPPPQKN